MIGVIDYGLGNVGSIINMLGRLGYRAATCQTPAELDKFEGLILPGVGAFDEGMTLLGETGFIEPLNDRVLSKGVPILGICLGMQLMTEGSEEGEMPGLGWFPYKNVRFDSSSVTVPHIGWNDVKFSANHPLAAGLEEDARFYFVHSYHVKSAAPEHTMCECSYRVPFAAGLSNKNMLGVQFHPEKSHRYGKCLLTNFVNLVKAKQTVSISS